MGKARRASTKRKVSQVSIRIAAWLVPPFVFRCRAWLNQSYFPDIRNSGNDRMPIVRNGELLAAHAKCFGLQSSFSHSIRLTGFRRFNMGLGARCIFTAFVPVVFAVASIPTGNCHAQAEGDSGKDLAIVESLLRLGDTDLSQRPKAREAVSRYLATQEGTTKYVELVETFSLRDKNSELAQLAASNPSSSQGANAARLLLKFGATDLIKNTLEGDDGVMAAGIATALGRVQNPETLAMLKPIVTDPSVGRPVRTAAATALGKNQNGQRFLLDLVHKGALPEDVRFAVANALLGSSNSKIRDSAAEVLQLPPSASSEVVPPIAVLANRRGDVDLGKKVFNTNGTCNKCHKVLGLGEQVGPDLTEIGSKLGRDALYVSILDPSAGVSHNFETYNLLTLDGIQISGVLVSQDDDSVTIKTAEAIERTILRDDIDEFQKQSISLMPADLQKAMTVDDLVNLVEYLYMLKSEEDSRFLDTSAAGDRAVADLRDPDSAAGGLDVADGLQVTLFASEPMMASPTNIDVDHLGRVWVCEVVNYRHFRNEGNPVREAGDRILVLEDTDGDGQADRKQVFYQGRDIDSAHGICVLGNRVIVSANDFVYILTDTNGDTRADKKEVLFSGIGGVQHDHGIHAFVFGPDGKLYFNFGNEGGQILDAQGKPIVDQAGNVVNGEREPYQQGMVFRCNLDGSEFETLGWNFRNNWEVSVDSFGGLWQSDNDDDGNRAVRINNVMEFGNYGYRDEFTGAAWPVERIGMHPEIPKRHWHLNDPGVVPNLLQTGAGSPTGILVYEGDLLPPPFRNQVIHCDAGPNVVRAYPVKETGAGYEATTVNILKGGVDKWFRPSDVCVAPDGSLIIADWYDPGVGGHRMGDVERGRLFRVSPQGSGKYSVPQFNFDSVDGAIKALSNPNLSVRYLAWTSLQKQGKAAESALASFFNDRSNDDRTRARALWVLGKLTEGGSAWVEKAIADSRPDIRIVGIRLARQLGIDLIPVATALVNDPSAMVRREVAIALRGNRSSDKTSLWVELAKQHDGKDRWYLEALGISADGQWDVCFPAWLEAVGDDWKSPGGRDIVWRCRAPQACKYLADIIVDPETPSDEVARYLRAFDFHPEQQRREALNAVIDQLASR